VIPDLLELVDQRLQRRQIAVEDDVHARVRDRLRDGPAVGFVFLESCRSTV
jgi:hypothetical protein